jgi:hypothetical protein
MGAKTKKFERRFLDILLSGEGIPKPAAFTHRDRPDFLLQYTSGAVGVEVTGLCRPPEQRNSRLWEGACEGVLEAARRVWESRGLRRVLVNVTFNNNRAMFPKSSWAEWGQRLAAVVEQNLPEPGRHVLLGLGDLDQQAALALPPEVHTIFVQPTISANSRWTLATSGAIYPLSHATLQDVIRGKNARVPAYRLVAPTLWLIVAINDFYLSSEFDLESSSEALDGSFETTFDRVFLVPAGKGVFYELDRYPPENYAA